MTRKTTLILLSLSIFCNYSCRNSAEEKITESCFTKNNFDKVYEFINNQNIKTKTTFLKYDDIQVCLKGDSEIAFKKDGYTLSKIYREKGIIALQMLESDNNKMEEKTNRIFCELISKATK